MGQIAGAGTVGAGALSLALSLIGCVTPLTVDSPTLASLEPGVVASFQARPARLNGHNLLLSPRLNLDTQDPTPLARNWRVSVGGVDGTDVRWVSTEVLLITLPPLAPGEYDVTAVGPSGASASLPRGLRVEGSTIDAGMDALSMPDLATADGSSPLADRSIFDLALVDTAPPPPDLAPADAAIAPPDLAPADAAMSPPDLARADVGMSLPDLAVSIDMAACNRACPGGQLCVAGACLTATFAPPVNYPTGQNPFNAIAADLNGDGIPDVAVTNYNSNTITLLFGVGDGTLKAQPALAAGPSTYALTSGDFNRDGRADIACTNQGDWTAQVFLGTGLGGFAAPSLINLAGQPGALTAADFNGDGRPDLAIEEGSYIDVFLGNGMGGFGPRQATQQPGNNPVCLAAADLDGDLRQDLVSCTKISNDARVYPGLGTGLFGAPSVLSNLPTVEWVTIRDFDRDGRLDLAFAILGGDRVGLLFGRANGTFAAEVALPLVGGSQPLSVEAGDFNHDGLPDLVAAATGRNAAGVLLGDGTGKFGAPLEFAVPIGPWVVLVADFDRDGRQDIASVSNKTNTVSVLLNQTP